MATTLSPNQKLEMVASDSAQPSDIDDGDRTDNTNTNPTMNTEVEEELLKELKFAKFIVKCPCLLCGIILVILLIICGIDAVIFEFTGEGDRTYFPNPPDKYVDAIDAFILATDLIGFSDNSTSKITQSAEEDYFDYQMFFTLSDYKGDFDENNPENTDYWILTPDNIKTIIKWEDKIAADNEWQSKFCFLGEDPMETNYTCQINTGEAAIISPARYVQDYFDDMGKGDSYTTEQVKTLVMNDLINNDEFNLRYCFNPGVAGTNQTYIYRSFFRVGTPIGNGKFSIINGTRVHLTDYKNSEDLLWDEQEPLYREWALPIYYEMLLDPNAELSDGGLDILVQSWTCFEVYYFDLLFGSFTFFGLAVLIVVVYMTFHLQSIFLALSSMLQIIMSFPLAYLLYRVIFGIQYFDFLNTLIIFVLLGVGADDVFVFTDAWLQSVHFVGNIDKLTGDDAKNCCGFDKSEEPKNIIRMSFTYRRAAKAMLVTQITTFFAFLATAISPLMPMSAFGIWAATVVAMNYILVITLYPTILIIHHKYIKSCEQKMLCFCCNLCGSKKESESETYGSTEKPSISRQMSVEEQSEEYRTIERFLGIKWSKFIIRFRWFCLTFFLILMGVSIGLATQITTATEIESFLFDDDPASIAAATLDEFTATETDALVDMRITFGIAGVDRTGSKKYDTDNDYGTIIWQDSFEISSIEQQEYLLFICDEFKQQSVDNGGDLVYNEELTFCPIVDFAEYLVNGSDTFPYVYGGSDMTQNEAFTNKWIEFLFSEYGISSLENGLTYVDLDVTPPVIRYYAIYFQTQLSGYAAGNEAQSFLDDMEEYIASLTDSSSDCPDNLCDRIFNVGFKWVLLSVANAFIISAIQGIAIATPLAFIVMIFSTQNWIIALFAVIDIIGVMATELAFIYVNGWDFGLSESVSIVIIIGFSVDYVVHLANAYLESKASTRNERLSFALLTMGISVVSGAVTTFGAGFFLIFPPITYFRKMGYIMMSTVVISIIWAMCFFTSICAALGPQNNTGNITQYFKRCCGNKKDDIDQ